MSMEGSGFESSERDPRQMADEALEVLRQGPAPEELVREALSKLEEAKSLMSPELRKEVEKMEILAGVGAESIDRLKEEINDLEGEERREGEDDETYQARQGALRWYQGALKQVEEL